MNNSDVKLFGFFTKCFTYIGSISELALLNLTINPITDTPIAKKLHFVNLANYTESNRDKTGFD